MNIYASNEIKAVLVTYIVLSFSSNCLNYGQVFIAPDVPPSSNKHHIYSTIIFVHAIFIKTGARCRYRPKKKTVRLSGVYSPQIYCLR